MDVTKIVAEIDAKIASLQQARSVLLGLDEVIATEKPRRGRPKGSKNATKSVAAPKRKRKLSAEGRKRIVEAMKRRWASQKAVAEKPAKKAAPVKEAAAKKASPTKEASKK
jgi:hypothetical protein